MTKKAIVDFIIPSLIFGGAEKVVMLLAQEFHKDGFHVRIIVRRGNEGGYFKQAQETFELVNLRARRVRNFPFRLARFYFKNPKPETVIANLWPLTFLAVLTIKLLNFKTKVLCIEHGSLKHQVSSKPWLHSWFLRSSLKVSIKLSHRVIGVSQGLKEELEELSNYLGEKVINIANPIEQTKRVALAEDNTIEKISKLISGHIYLFVGRLKKVKNIPLIITAFKEVSAKYDSTLLIVGDGAELLALKALTTELNLDNRVFFLGFIQNCSPFYEIANTLVLSSNSEGFGNVIVEALMAGCTIVSTDCPYGPREILNNGEFGYLSPVGSQKQFTEAMISAIHQPISPAKAIERGNAYLPQTIFERYIQALQ